MLTSDSPSRRGHPSYNQCPENRTTSKQPVFLIDPELIQGLFSSYLITTIGHNWSKNMQVGWFFQNQSNKLQSVGGSTSIHRCSTAAQLMKSHVTNGQELNSRT